MATLTVLEGPEIGAFYVLEPGRSMHRIGRAEDADISIKSPSVSRYHAICDLKAREGHVATKIRDNGSTNGILINGNPTREGWLIAGDKVRLGDVLLRFQWMPEDEARYHTDVSDRIRAAQRDHLTGLWTRAWVFERLPAVLADARRRDVPVSAILADLDHFKGINDQHGHLVGDTVLSRTSKALLAALGPREHGVRYGGEEFLFILPERHREDAGSFAELLRAQLESLDLADAAAGLTVTGSFGVAEWGAEESVDSWLERADAALYAAKRQGRNRVVLAQLPDASGEVATWNNLPTDS